MFLFIYFIYLGDPEAEAGSVEHALYEQGLRSASVCTLVLSVAYVLFSLCHSKVLAVLGKATYTSLLD